MLPGEGVTTRLRLLPNGVETYEDDDDVDDGWTAGSSWVESCGWNGAAESADDGAVAGGATGKRMRSGDACGAVPENVRAPPEPNLIRGDWRAGSAALREVPDDADAVDGCVGT